MRKKARHQGSIDILVGESPWIVSEIGSSLEQAVGRSISQLDPMLVNSKMLLGIADSRYSLLEHLEILLVVALKAQHKLTTASWIPFSYSCSQEHSVTKAINNSILE